MSFVTKRYKNDKSLTFTKLFQTLYGAIKTPIILKKHFELGKKLLWNQSGDAK